MKLNKLTLIAGAIALGLGTIPMAAQADSNTSSVIVAQAKQGQEGKGGRWEKLGLTADQKAKMQAIREQTRAQINEILTPQQREQLAAAKQSGQKKRGMFRSLELSDTQKTQIREIMESKKTQIQSILTDEQIEQLEQMRQNRGQRRGGRMNRQ